MRNRTRTLWTLALAAACIPLAFVMWNRRSARRPAPVVRFATFNAALNRSEPGALRAELASGECEQARKIAEIVQRCRVDVLLVCELDRDDAAESARLLAERYFAVSQDSCEPIRYPFRYVGPSNTGVPSGLDLDLDGKIEGPGDCFGFGRFEGQYGMALFSRYPILEDRIRTFAGLRWSAMPGALRPDGYGDECWSAMRLSSKSHWDVPIGIGTVEEGLVVHALCSHPTPPVFDGPEDRNGRRNHDEIRFWIDYLSPPESGWIVDDLGRTGGLPAGEPFVILGDLNCDPVDGDSRHDAIVSLLEHPRVRDPMPRSSGAVASGRLLWPANHLHEGDSELDTFCDEQGKGPGNLRLDYVLPSANLAVTARGVFWPAPEDPLGALVTASDHRLVWVEFEVGR
ncbi:MAG: endonuclease/exonuclease/phosphatase family protein [Planctomycetota bacterium]